MQSNAKPGIRGFMGRLIRAIVVTGTLASPAMAAPDTAWLDLEGRIQYGFYTEDARILTDIADQLARGDAEQEPLQYYYAGLANYRLSLLLANRDKARARAAAESCAESVGAALKVQREFAAGYALHAACLRTVSALTPWKPLANTRSAGQMERAVKLAPRDPRVLLLEALANGQDARLDEQALATLKRAAAAFESERQGVDRTPGWGAAEAYTYLGRGYLERGDVLNARDALERALLIAPDFALAKRLLTRITTG
jgi:tetratricopeptide (TPR) repeat protein